MTWRSNSCGGFLRPICAAPAAVLLAWLAICLPASAQTSHLMVEVDKPGAAISPTLYGLMTEEINYSYDGGLYGELIQNRSFKDAPAAGRGGRGPAPAPSAVPHWSVVLGQGAAGSIAKDTADPVNTTALQVSLKLSIDDVAAGQRVGVANDGFWGIPVKPNTTYSASFYARSGDITGPLTADIESEDGATVYASGTVPAISDKWQQYRLSLKTGDVAESAKTRFVISAASKGTVYFSLVSLFPPTFNDRPNGNRVDLMNLLAGLHPTFLRFPGGNYLEGQTIADYFNWENTIGPLENRPGHLSPWRYRSSDGMGLLEFLNWCEDLKMQPLLAVFAGYTLDGKAITDPTALQPYVQQALDEIEYVTGDQTTKWGQQRAKDGHPKPFDLTYVEVGNEDSLSGRDHGYEQRFPPFFDAIRAKYPAIKIIATANVRARTPDVVDDHFYLRTPAAMLAAGQIHRYDRANRNGPKIFVGEWATREGNPTADLHSGIADAAWMTEMENNSDLILMASYAPLFVNVNPGGMQWPTDLIGYDTLHSFGSASYWAQSMFGANMGTTLLKTSTDLKADTLFFTSSQDAKTGDVILKVVNPQTTAQTVEVDIKGVAMVNKSATQIVLTGDATAVNTVAKPENVSAVTSTISDAGTAFSHEFPPLSATVIRVGTR
jgi:alpha-N-arabinofuranosidase